MIDVDLKEYQEANKKFNNAYAFFNFQFNDAMQAATNVFFRQN